MERSTLNAVKCTNEARLIILTKGSLVILRRDIFLAFLLSVHEVSSTTLSLTCQKSCDLLLKAIQPFIKEV